VLAVLVAACTLANVGGRGAPTGPLTTAVERDSLQMRPVAQITPSERDSLLAQPSAFLCHEQRYQRLGTWIMLDVLVLGDTSQWQQFTVEFDTTGTPWMMAAQREERPARGIVRDRGFIVHFLAGGPASWGAQDVDSIRPATEPMSDLEVARARALATWLWTRPCAKER
jgi:hypothetical protein